MDKLKTYNTPNGIISQLDTFKGLKVLIGDYASFSYCFTKTVLDSLGINYVIEHTMYGVKQRILNGEKYDVIFTNNVYESGSGKMLLDKLKEILTNEEYEILVYRIVHDFKFTHIAKILNTSRETIRRRYNEIITKSKNHLGGNDNE